jgi:hypothetical protein
LRRNERQNIGCRHEYFPDERIVATLSQQLSWSHFREILPLEDPLKRDFCAGKTEGHVRLLRLEESGIHAAQYLTELPPREVLERKLHDAIRLARERLARQPQERPCPAGLPEPAKQLKRKTK